MPEAHASDKISRIKNCPNTVFKSWGIGIVSLDPKFIPRKRKIMIILLAGIVPAIYLIIKVYRMDKIEKEPLGLIVRLFIWGALTTFAAMILEEIGMIILDCAADPTTMLYVALENFIVVGISEEFVKRWALKRVSWKNPAFNYHFDAVVYAVTVSLGFAALENVLYIMDFGLSIAPVRAVTSIPLHGICGVFMGFYYGNAKAAEQSGEVSKMQGQMLRSLLVPVLIHGFYDFTATLESDMAELVWLVFIIVLYIVAFRSLKKYSREDSPIGTNTWWK